MLFMTNTVRGLSERFTPVPWSSRPSKIMTVPAGAVRLIAGGRGVVIGWPVPGSLSSLCEPGTTRVPPLCGPMSSSMNMVLQVNGAAASETVLWPE